MIDRQLDRQSRILVIPATSARDAERQAERIITSLVAEDGSVVKDADAEFVENEDGTIDWHITNRYYEADVHFKIADKQLLRLSTDTSSRSGGRHTRFQRMIQLRDTPAEDIDDAAGSKLDDQVRDVFAALQLETPSQTSQAIRARSKAMGEVVREEVEGVQAVMLLVDREKSVSEHQRLLSSLGISGFDLAISLVVALPTPLKEDGTVTNFSTIGQSEQAEFVYAGEGWEYIDLAAGAESMESDEDSREGYGDDDDEKHGVERIREALMTHAWPGLSRNVDRSRAAGNQSGEAAEQNSTLTALRSNLDEIDREGLAQPTAKDEELARAFLARIEAAQARGFGQSTAVDQIHSTKSNAELDAALQRFLEEEDTQWPAKHGENGEEAWNTAGSEQMLLDSEGQTAFEDDFSDFVRAEPADGRTADDHAQSATSNGGSSWEEGGDEEIAFLGDEDDALLLRAFNQRLEGSPERLMNDSRTIDFESTLNAVLAHAERVRAIPDHEQRREEAARVALALLDR